MQTRPMPRWLHNLYLALFVLLPWSVEVRLGSWCLTVPSEPLTLLAGLGVGVALLREKRLLRPTVLPGLTAVWMLWQAIASLCSTMPLVSWKYMVVEAGHWWVFFVGLLCWPGQIPGLVRGLGWSTAGAALYALAHHAAYGFRTDQARLAPLPFFNDHNLLSAVLLLLLFVFLLPRIAEKKSAPERFLLPLWILALGLIASRAAWGSLLAVGAVGYLLHKGGRRTLILALGAGLCTAWLFWEKVAGYAAADVSARERLNRFACALRMAADRPFTGFGPGTYAFQYLPYQKPEEMTRISILAPITERSPSNYGRGGGAHSEYLRALSETGVPGLGLWLLLVAGSLRVAWQRCRSPKNTHGLFLLLGLLGFFLLGLTNEFLHDGRVAALVWGGIAVLARVLKSKDQFEI